MAKRIEHELPNRINLVAENTVLEGTLYIDGDVRIDGHIIGKVNVQQRIVIGEKGSVEGNVIAAEADVTGCVQGDLAVTDGLMLRSTSRVEGRIKAGHLTIEDGAVFNGTCQMGPSAWTPRPEARAPQEALPSAVRSYAYHKPEEVVASEEEEALAEVPAPVQRAMLAAEGLATPEALPDSAPSAELPEPLAETELPVEEEPLAEIEPLAEAALPVEAEPLVEAEAPEGPVDVQAEPEAGQAPDVPTEPAEEAPNMEAEPVPSEAHPPIVVPTPPRPAIQSRLRSKRPSDKPAEPSRVAALGAAIPGLVKQSGARLARFRDARGKQVSLFVKQFRARLTLPVTVGVILTVATGAVLTMYLLGGGFRSAGPNAATTTPSVAQPLDQPAAQDASLDEANTPPSTDAALATTDAGSELVSPDNAAADLEAVRQTAQQQAALLEQARQRVATRLNEADVRSLGQQAEAHRSAGIRAFEAEEFEQAARSFRSSQQVFLQIKQTLDAKDQALADATEPPAADPVATEDATPPAEPDPQLPSAQPAVQRLAGYLKSNIEGENAGGMQALFHRGWEPFFEQANGIRATVQTGAVEVNGTRATVSVQVDLQYRDSEQASQQDTRAYTWTLQYMDRDWMLMRVAVQ